MNIHIDGTHRVVLPVAFTEHERAEVLPNLEKPVRVEAPTDWQERRRAEDEAQQAQEDRAAVAAMDVVEELSGAQFDDEQFNHLMEFFGMHIAELVRTRVASGWQETPLEAKMLERVADYADFIKEWRSEGEARHIFVALEELAKAARHAALFIREEDARPEPAPF